MDSDQIKGKLQDVFGKAEEAVGKAIGNQNLANAGAEDRLKGSATETWGNAKDTVHNVGESVKTHASVNEEHTGIAGESLRERVVSGAEHLKSSINIKMDEVKEHEAERRDGLNRSV